MMDEKLLAEVVQRLTRIEVKLEEIVDVKRDVERLKEEVIELKAKDIAQEKEITELKDNNKWITRAVIGAIITAAFGLIFALVKTYLGA